MKRGITRRFLINGLGMVVLVLVLVGLLFFFLSRQIYYQNVENTLLSYANTSLDLFAQYTGEPDYDVEAGARSFVENFRDRETVEIQFLDRQGNALVTSSGFVPDSRGIGDWEKALASDAGIGSWRGKSVLGEHVMSACVLLRQEGELCGGLRYIVSLRLVDRQLGLLVGGVALAALAVLFFVTLSSSYFIGSIINPVKGIGRAARAIANGHYESRIEKTYDDEIGELCDTINYMAEEIANTERMKNEFISSVSHELRTPLTAIKGWSETLSGLGADDAELIQKGLAVITDETERLSGIVEELLDFSRIQNGRFSMKIERMDVLAELEETIVLFRERAARAGLRLHYIEPPSLPPIMGDKDRLRQVFINVMDNAIKYSHADGTIRVEAATMGQAVQVVISDRGVGIPAEELPLVKNKFYRVSKNGGIPGSGIGLAIADEIMRMHGGQLDIESTEGVGTAVILTLPTTLNLERV